MEEAQVINTYIIEGVEFQRKDLSIIESDAVNKLLKYQINNTIEVKGGDSEKFLSMVLTPINIQPEQMLVLSRTPFSRISRLLYSLKAFITRKKLLLVCFGNCNEDTAAEVLKHFFTRRIKNGLNLQMFFNDLINESKKSTAKQNR
ncbi:MAG: hypothetical protein IPM56_16270 [Ignavibacteriales bacterium]|nr:MAG: hypothetical protein IPM56_16270 [Ignavibacteriales bacterium]